MNPHGFCEDLYGFCEKTCEATGAKLLILLEHCASAWFSEKSGTGRKKLPSGSPTSWAMRVTEVLMLFMSLSRSFPI